MGGPPQTLGSNSTFWVQGGTYGRYRNTSQTLHSNSLNAASQAQYEALARQAAAAAIAQQAAFNSCQSGFGAGLAGATTETPQAVKNTGIEVGEVEAWRAWRVEHGWLYSMTMGGVEWEPGKPMEAHKVGLPMGEGIHAFKTRKQALDEYDSNPALLVVGRVSLWGDVIEFSKGWHAEFAAVASLEFKNSDDIDLDELRATYGLAP